MMSADVQNADAAVLVVDDDRTLRLLAREALELNGFSVHEAEDGAAALARFEHGGLDVVLLDVNMPRMDGFQACAELRKHPRGKDTPVLMMTALEDVAAIERAYEVGATDFIHKPIQWAILGHRVRYMLRASRTAAEFRSVAADLRQVAEDLRRSEAKLANAQRIAQLGWWEWDVETNELIGSEQFYRILGVAQQDFGGTYEAFLPYVHPDDRIGFEERFDTLLRDKTACDFDHGMVRRDGSERTVHEQAEVAVDETGRAVRVNGTIQDVTERKRAEEQIRFLAHYDGLTQLPNRSFFKQRLDLALEAARRHSRLAAILFLDLDRFKRINDTFGHSGGDVLLREVAGRLAGCVRETDCVTRPLLTEWDSVVARLGGDEFIILLSEVGRVEDAARVARRVIEALSSPFTLNGQEVVATTSIGIALYPFDGEDADSLLKNADTAMYHAKDQGRNNYQFYTESMNAAAFERLRLERDLHRALERDEFVLHYQPQVALPSGQIVGAEALIRWQHPEMGLVPPGRFISIAEEIGLIVPLGEWVLQSACAQRQAWHEAGLRAVRMSVNVSGRQFKEQDFVAAVASVLERTGLSAGNLDVELTETIVMDDVEASIRTLNALKELGVRLSVDDFGTGYSSLSYLRRLPLDALKIDRSFLKDVPQDPDHVAITSAILALGHSLHLTVVAEGVESEAQLSFLRERGCDEAQGYLLGHPLPAEEFGMLLGTEQILPTASRPGHHPPSECPLPDGGPR